MLIILLGVPKLGKTQVASRSEIVEDDSDNLTDSSDEDDPKDAIIEKVMRHSIYYVPKGSCQMPQIPQIHQLPRGHSSTWNLGSSTLIWAVALAAMGNCCLIRTECSDLHRVLQFTGIHQHHP